MRRRLQIDIGPSQKKVSHKGKVSVRRSKGGKHSEETGTISENDQQTKKIGLKQRLENLEYGNYPSYYKYRNKNESNVDEHHDQRLDHFKMEWFENKDVLDIGCNVGDITYQIAKLFKPKKIIGLDIDERLINKAMKNLYSHMKYLGDSFEKLRRERAKKQHQQSEHNSEQSYKDDPLHFPISCYLKNGPLIVAHNRDCNDIIKELKQSSGSLDDIKDGRMESASSSLLLNNVEAETADLNEIKEDWSNREDCPIDMEELLLQSDQCNKFPNNITFIAHDYVLDTDDLVNQQEAYYDVVVCLSVTKWIHLNYRDDGLKRFLKRIFLHLKPNGILILEAQPFTNYFRRKKLSQRIKDNYQSIQLKPEQFESLLLSNEIGFATCIYTGLTSHAHPGFQRPIQVFRKD